MRRASGLHSRGRGGSSKALPPSWKRSAVTLASVAFFAVAASLVACDAVLGLDAPQLDPCASDACVDGAAPPPPGDAATDAPDAGIDAKPINGVRCGGGGSPAIGCENATPICCVSLDAGLATYGCVSNSAACSGYPIACATDNDCPGSEVCCHYDSAIKCEPETTCASASLVCDPDGSADQCPTGDTCSVAFTNGSYTLPYYGCAP